MIKQITTALLLTTLMTSCSDESEYTTLNKFSAKVDIHTVCIKGQLFSVAVYLGYGVDTEQIYKEGAGGKLIPIKCEEKE